MTNDMGRSLSQEARPRVPMQVCCVAAGQAHAREAKYLDTVLDCLTGLRAVGGADWVYRQLLETKLSIFAHFRGNGRTHNEVRDPDGLQPDVGLIEFVGPNRKINTLPEVAVIHLDRLTIEDTYSTAGTSSLKGR